MHCCLKRQKIRDGYETDYEETLSPAFTTPIPREQPEFARPLYRLSGARNSSLNFAPFFFFAFFSSRQHSLQMSTTPVYVAAALNFFYEIVDTVVTETHGMTYAVDAVAPDKHFPCKLRRQCCH